MISRLLLVGMVGVLGISLPDGAEWGTGLTWAHTGTTACTGHRDAVAFEPIAVDVDTIDRIADELNRHSEGLNQLSAPIADVAKRPRKAFAPVPSCDSVELKLLVESCRIAGEAEMPVAIPPRSILQPAATENGVAVDRIFAENRIWGDPTTKDFASNVQPTRERRPSFEPITVAETSSELADELNRSSEGIDIAPVNPAMPTLQRPSFEPIAVADDASSLADELNRENDGRSVAPNADRGIGNAIRLTSNAALAWMNVLTKTVPTVSASR